MKYIFIEKWIETQTGDKFVQLLENERFSRTVTSRIIPESELRNVYNTNDCCNFELKDNGFVITNINIPILNMPRQEVRSEADTLYTMKPALRCIYDLFEELMDDNAYLFYDTGIETLTRAQNYVTDFIPKYSQGTMSVYVTANNNGYWRSKKIIYAEGNHLKVNSFYVLVKDPIKYKDLEFIQEVELCGVTYALMKYDNALPLVVYQHNDVVLFESLINEYAYSSVLYKNYIKAARFLKAVFCEETETLESRGYVSKMEFINNITFKHNLKDISKDALTYMLDDLLNVVLPRILKENNPEYIVEYLRDYPILEKSIASFMLKIATNTKIFRDKVELLQVCNKEIEFCSKMQAKFDAFLYAFRVDQFIYLAKTPYVGEIAKYGGGTINSVTKMIRRMDVR